jgi:hypothetical protein
MAVPDGNPMQHFFARLVHPRCVGVYHDAFYYLSGYVPNRPLETTNRISRCLQMKRLLSFFCFVVVSG